MTKKIDPIGFACLISKVAAIRGEELYHGLVGDFHDLVEGCFPEPEVQTSNFSSQQLDLLLHAIQKGAKIEAIKQYRVLTSLGLKEAKDAIEKYWYVHDSAKEATLGDILNTATAKPTW